MCCVQRDRILAEGLRTARQPGRLVAHERYFDTLQFNNGEIRGTKFAPGATRNENGLAFTEIEAGFRTGRYRFNNRVRDRDCFLVDEVRSAVMCRGYIDHKGVLDEYRMTDGTLTRSVFREPQTWSFFEAFKVKDDAITAVEATFTGAPNYIRSPLTQTPSVYYRSELRRAPTRCLVGPTVEPRSPNPRKTRRARPAAEFSISYPAGSRPARTAEGL